MEKKRIACFFTGGYTELHAMKLFIRKINDGVDYIQLHPHRQRKSTEDIKNRRRDSIDSEQSGRTGEALIRYILDFIGKDIFTNEHYDAILIEDDTDERFLSIQPDGSATIDLEKWKQEQAEIVTRITEKLDAKHLSIPVFFLYAAPEIEGWFLADWDNSFGQAYEGLLTTGQNKLFSVQFRKYVNNNILTHQYANAIESYGYFNGSYKKLSEEIQNALSGVDFWKWCSPESMYPPVHYSKKVQGAAMLAEIDPQIVSRSCTTFFKNEMLALQEL